MAIVGLIKESGEIILDEETKTGYFMSDFTSIGFIYGNGKYDFLGRYDWEDKETIKSFPHTVINKIFVENSKEVIETTYVQAELDMGFLSHSITLNWGKPVSSWKFQVCYTQDIVPDWYLQQPAFYENKFREAVQGWVDRHVIFNQPDFKIIKPEYYIPWGTTTISDFPAGTTIYGNGADYIFDKGLHE